ncbi:MAG: hypothetical protein ABJC66_02815 [Gammaproteobacteria bacterium]
MTEGSPPKFALWLLKHLGSPYHRESLIGDLIEQSQEGRSRVWCCRQVILAILLARLRCIRALPRTAAGGVLSYLLDGRLPRRRAIKALLLAFGVLALGVGTITWALTAP